MKKILWLLGIFLCYPALALANSEQALLNLHIPAAPTALFCLVIFVLAYILVMTEEFTHLRKSKPVVLTAGIIWLVIGIICQQQGLSDQASNAIKHNILEYAELFMFLLVAMTYINAMEERLVFDALRTWLIKKGFSYRQLFWVTGVLAFCISPVADNLTTALLMCAVVMAVGINSPLFINLACINIVVAANAGGAFSPFGDITTLMVWQKHKLEFTEFFHIFIPSVVSYLVPALCMHFALPNLKPEIQSEEVQMKFGAKRIIVLFILTIITAISFHNYLHLPPMVGMMTGLGYLNFFAYYLKRIESKQLGIDIYDTPSAGIDNFAEAPPFDIFNKIKRAEWDTLFFFYGVILSVGGLATLGYLEIISKTMYLEWGSALSPAQQATPANIAVGFLSAIIDNIPVMFAVLTMDPVMSKGQWLLVTLTAGVGGSMLSIGSAAGVALMGQSGGYYTFFGHLKWMWAIALGYVLAIATHLVVNQQFF